MKNQFVSKIHSKLIKASIYIIATTLTIKGAINVRHSVFLKDALYLIAAFNLQPLFDSVAI